MSSSLGSVLHLKRRFLRSISIERDAKTGVGLDGYIPTPTALAAKERIASGITNPALRAVSLTGSYGTGKSAFALYLADQLAPSSSGTQRDGFLPIFITGGREALIPALMRALDAAVYGQVSFENQTLTAKQAAERFGQAAKDVRRKSKKYQGILLIVDELGKFLEFATQYPERSDLQVLQEIAEMAARSGEAPVLFLTILHQAFEEYAQRLSSIQRAEWQKVQGRFVDIPFGDSTDEVVRLIGRAFDSEDAGELIRTRSDVQAEQANNLGLLPRGLVTDEVKGIFQAAFGLHPLVLLALPFLFKRFAQSERTLFSFLGEEDPQGFGTYIQEQTVTSQYRLDALFDYVSGALGTTLYSAQGYGRIWSQIEEAVARCESRGDVLESRVVKTVSLLHLLGESARLMPSREVVRFALADETTSINEIDAALRRLTQATILIFRKHKNAYRPFEGSDIDIEERLSEARSALGNAVSLSAVAEKRLPLSPIVARRHLFKTGSLRHFEVSLCTPSDLGKQAASEPTVADGSLLLCLTSDTVEQRDTVQRAIMATASDLNRAHVVIAICLTTDALRDVAFTVESLEWVRENTPGLDGDPVAFREVSERRYEALQELETQWARLLLPESKVMFVWNGEQRELSKDGNSLQQFLSDAFLVAYSKSPILRNELLNRRQASSTATAARRDLIEAMILYRHLPTLGIDGFPAHRMMYETLLLPTGLHRKSDDSEDWGFFSPSKTRDTLHINPVWREIEHFLRAGDLVKKPITQLYARLQQRPFGVAEGVLPVLIVAALLCWEDEILVYDNGAIITKFDPPTAERLLKRPQDFAVHGLRIAGERQAVLTRFGRGLLPPSDKRTIVNVVRAIYAQVNKLPVYTRSTGNLGDTAKSLRDALKEARNPESFLFVELPQLFEVRPFTAEQDSANVDAFFAAWNPAFTELTEAYASLLTRLQSSLLETFGAESIDEMRTRAQALLGRVSDPKLLMLVTRLAAGNIVASSWMESVAAGVIGRVPETWTDADETRFVNALPSLDASFRSAELVAFAMTEAQSDAVDEERSAMRVSVAAPGGHEDARVIIMSRRRSQQAEESADKLKRFMKRAFKDQRSEVQMAALGYVMREMLKNADKGK